MTGLIRNARLPLLIFALVTSVLFVVVALSALYVPRSPWRLNAQPLLPEYPWVDGWTRFDAGWYWGIAKNGYYFNGSDEPSSIAFFPGYPLAMRLLTPVFRNPLLAGIAVTVVCGAFVSALFYRWTLLRMDTKMALASLLALLLYPFAYYLNGAVYADAMFLAAALGAFVAVESDRPLLAGVLGAVATATRPVGLAVVVGLVVLTVERRITPGGPATLATLRAMLRAPRLLQARHWLVLLSPLGLGLYALYLWYQFGDPYTFMEAESGWGHRPGIETWLKFDILYAFLSPHWHGDHLRIATHLFLTLSGFALTPVVFRRFGWGYGVYTLCVLAIPAISSKDLVGMGRYMLAAFPVFAALGLQLAPRPWLLRTYLAASAMLLVIMTSLYSRWHYLT
ncbi:MAG TPA: mannosyltransferase family protein [Polyangiaceae bacterium]